MGKLRGKLITNFSIDELELYKTTLLLYDKTREKGLCIEKDAYDQSGKLLSNCMALHKQNKGDLSDFWRLFESLSDKNLKVVIRDKKLKRILK